MTDATPPHHTPDGRFRNPWPAAADDDRLRARVWRFALERWFGRHAPDPGPHALPAGEPEPALPRVRDPRELRVTWVGHATALLQLPGINVLTDPVWSERCSPVPFAGSRRFVPAGLPLDELPPIDAVLLSHDHYDHLDAPTVRDLARRHPDATWLTPRGYRDWMRANGVTRLEERDWWQEAALDRDYRAICVPARHWTRRTLRGTNTRLWSGWVLAPVEGDGPRAYFAGDSGYCPAFTEIGGRLGPFAVSLVPIGAYEPRWFMHPSHMNPEEAVQAYRDAGGRGAFVGIHWGTWRLTFEDPLEPPVRVRRAWEEAGLPAADLHVLRHGQTMRHSIGPPGP